MGESNVFRSYAKDGTIDKIGVKTVAQLVELPTGDLYLVRNDNDAMVRLGDLLDDHGHNALPEVHDWLTTFDTPAG